jgi:hypothetical protein
LLKRHRHTRGNWFASVALLFVAPQTRSGKIVRFSRTPICGATNTLVENGSLQSRSYLWRHKHARGKGPISNVLHIRMTSFGNSCQEVCYGRNPDYNANSVEVFMTSL